MSIEDKYELLTKFLKEMGFGINLNMNDTFGWACAESYNMDMSDLEFVLTIYKQYGGSGVNAFAAVKTGQDVLKEIRDENYIKAKKIIIEYLSGCSACQRKLDPTEESGIHLNCMNGSSLLSGESMAHYCLECAVKIERERKYKVDSLIIDDEGDK